MKRSVLLLLLAAAAIIIILTDRQGAGRKKNSYPALVPSADRSGYGKHIQRTMTLLESTAPAAGNKVRIVFYGQSTSPTELSDEVGKLLRSRYPHADIEILNYSIHGFCTDLLKKTLFYEVIPEYPDLVIFQAYGKVSDTEEIVRNIKRLTTAEVLIRTEHPTKWPEKIAADREGQKTQSAKDSYWYIPDIARDHKSALLQVYKEWAEYIIGNKLRPADLLRDNIHFNDHGIWLMARLINRFMVYLPNEPDEEWKDIVKTYKVGKDVNWNGNELTLNFHGNRVVAVAEKGKRGSAEVFVDGKKPSEFPESYVFSKPQAHPFIFWPPILQISGVNPLLAEDWTAIVKDLNEDGTDFVFDLFGSKTGYDGSGRGNIRFVSESGRIVIEPADWMFGIYKKYTGKTEIPAKFTVTWKVIPLFNDYYIPPEAIDDGKEYSCLLSQGIPNTEHTLTLIAGSGEIPSIKEIRVYRPEGT